MQGRAQLSVCRDRSDFLGRYQPRPATAATEMLARVAFREHHSIWRGIERCEKFRNQPSLDGAGFSWRREIAHDCFEPGILAHAKDDAWMFSNLQFVHWCLCQQIAKHTDTLHHFLTDLFLGNFLHGLRHEQEITVVSNMEFDLVPNVGEQRPRIVEDHYTQHFRVGKFDHSSARMVTGKIFPAEFPQRGVEVTDVDHVTSSIFDLDTIADLIWPADEDVYPTEKTCHRRLHCQTDDHRADPDGDERSVPINKNDADNDDGDG